MAGAGAGQHRGLRPGALEEMPSAVLGALAALWAGAAVLCMLGPSREYRLGAASVFFAVGLVAAAVKSARRRSEADASWLVRRDPSAEPASRERPAFTAGQSRLGLGLALLVLAVWALLMARQIYAEVQVRSSGVPARAIVSSAPLEFQFSGDVCVYVYGRVTTGPPLCSRPIGAGVMRVGDEVAVHVDRHDPRAVVIDAGLPPGSDMAAVVLLGLVTIGLLARRRGRRFEP